MDNTLILRLGNDQANFDISDFSNGKDVRAAMEEVFPGGNLDNLEFIDFADFPDSISNLPTDEMCDTLYDYHKAVQELRGDNEDAFKAFYEELGGTPTNLLTGFNDRYSGEFKESYDFGVDRAEACGINLAGNESFFDFEGFGESAANDYEILEDRYYFRY